MPLTVNASAQLRASAARLKAAGAVGVKTSMTRRLRAAAGPVPDIMSRSAQASLPRRGGLNEVVAGRKPKIQVRTTGRNAGVIVRYSGPGRYTDQASWRHPVFGHKDRKWAVTSYAPAGEWWERGQDEARPLVMAEMRGVLDDVAAEIMRLGI